MIKRGQVISGADEIAARLTIHSSSDARERGTAAAAAAAARIIIGLTIRGSSDAAKISGG